MGLTTHSTGAHALDTFAVRRKDGDTVVALAGNPNVGKSTVFNQLTGLKQHTGNWPGKTVANAQGACVFHGNNYVMVDIPGTYSLSAHSAEEEVARDFICFGQPDAIIVVCDATALERNLNLVLQTLEITQHVVVCVNLIDEAAKKHITLDLPLLSSRLGVPVVATCARSRRGLRQLMHSVDLAKRLEQIPVPVRYPGAIEQAIGMVQPHLPANGFISARWAALRLLQGEGALKDSLDKALELHLGDNSALSSAIKEARSHLEASGFSGEALEDTMVTSLVQTAEALCSGCVEQAQSTLNMRVDRIVTGKWAGIPLMLALLALVLWLTLEGANYPSELISKGLFALQDIMLEWLAALHAPEWLSEALILGVYRVVAWVVSVMLPPMAIFFPLFTLLEDVGYLPRVAFNLDKYFQKACAGGKQALTMCMGFGCNAAGVVGCRIIDSPRERLIAIITNNFVPCNGRFPTLIAIISMFFAATAGAFSSVLSVLLLTGVIVLGIWMTFIISGLLSKTVLKGIPSSFILELPPYRKPQIGKVVVRSLLDRTLFVLGRAVCVAAPAGLIIYLLSNISVNGMPLLLHCSSFLDPFASLMGLDGIILLAFILGFPANEIVMPLVIMAYMSTGSLMELESLSELRTLLLSHGWTWMTAVSVMLFSLMHWPCSTTLLTIHKETRSLKWTLVSFAVPTITGIVLCMAFTAAARLLA